jgi:hypothetical protein
MSTPNEVQSPSVFSLQEQRGAPVGPLNIGLVQINNSFSGRITSVFNRVATDLCAEALAPARAL